MKIKTELVRKYITRFPNTPSLTLAKKLYGENPTEFKDVEDARTIIRYHRGLRGKESRKSSNKSLHVKKGTFTNNPFKLPASSAKPPKVFYLPKACNNILFISDLHIPYHDNTAITIALQFGLKEKVNCIFINGDIIDFYQISRFTNVERKRSVKDELKLVRDFLDVLKKTFPNVPIYLLKGNHDNRLETYLAVKAPEVLDMDEFKLEVLLNADYYGMTVIKDTTLVKIGKLAVTHGHLLLRGVFAPVNAARGTYLRAKASTIISHVHKVSTHSEKTINNKVITTYSTGCLCELAPDYNPFGNNYSHGFAHIIVEKNGNYKVHNVQVIDGVIVS